MFIKINIIKQQVTFVLYLGYVVYIYIYIYIHKYSCCVCSSIVLYNSMCYINDVSYNINIY